MAPAPETIIFSIGHSTLPYADFVARLKAQEVSAVADVRTAPMSRHFPQYNRDELKDALARDGLAYVFLGKELGGRPASSRSYSDGVADYEKMAGEPEFALGLDRLERGARTYRIAMMCSERSPLDCHRCLLVGRALNERGVRVCHIVDDDLIDQARIEDRLLDMADKTQDDMFADEAQQLADAYRARAMKVAFRDMQDA